MNIEQLECGDTIYYLEANHTKEYPQGLMVSSARVISTGSKFLYIEQEVHPQPILRDDPDPLMKQTFIDVNKVFTTSKEAWKKWREYKDKLSKAVNSMKDLVEG